MDVRELERALKFRIGPYIKFAGIHTSDQLPFIQHNIKPVLFIANTLKSNANINTVGHWVVFYLEFDPVIKIIFFDSYGFSPYFYRDSGFSEFLSRYRNVPTYHFKKQLQPNLSVKCGLYVLLFIHFISHFGLNMFTRFLYSRFHFMKRYLSYNDKYVTEYFFKYLSKSPCSHWKSGNKRAITYKECISHMKSCKYEVVFFTIMFVMLFKNTK